MSVQTIMILLILGLSAGILSGLVGVGGGIILVPALIYFMAHTQQQAQGTTLGLLMLPVGFLAVMNYYKKGFVDVKLILILAVGFVVGGFFGSKLALSIEQSTLKKVFAVILLMVASKMLFIDK